ncbi:serine/threonine protein phosphatase [Desulfosporosinus sp. HMP52]|uniref:metallophosphoesterase family protein n=1 Tax=Desulfosporosinus sp. HMP52 TaxID=1487923 RepID=UPI00051FF273|nr:metallophosphoesterase family protein [Desulfosporosinus sp. HMP52]KGK87123.1 serine/threonine protein phosphatase [Desulfosporosinus sp. HMP52]
MERIAIISDIHGNLPALEAVLKDIESKSIRRIFCLGDIAGKGPSPTETVDLIKARTEIVIKGNWDCYLSEQSGSPVLKWHQDRLGIERLDYLRSLPIYKEFYISGKLLRLCHASPNDLFHRVYLTSEINKRLKLFEATPTLNVEADIVGYGDIHSAHIDNFSGKTIFNVGSVGNPLDITQASYGIIEGNLGNRDEGSLAISLVRVPYNVELSVALAELTDMPEKQEYIDELRTGIYRGLKS